MCHVLIQFVFFLHSQRLISFLIYVLFLLLFYPKYDNNKSSDKFKSNNENASIEYPDQQLLKKQLEEKSYIREFPYQDGSKVDLEILSELDEAEMEGALDVADNADTYSIFWKGNMREEEVRKLQAITMTRYMDMTVDPCVDFYTYACGQWSKYNPIPPDKAGYDTFEILRENIERSLKNILEETGSKNKKPFLYDFKRTKLLHVNKFDKRLQKKIYLDKTGGSTKDASLKAKYLYQSCMNEDILNYRGNTPLLNLLSEFGGWPLVQKYWDESQFDIILILGKLRLFNNDVLISEWIGPDIKNSDEYVIQIDQSTLGLPSREYFLEPLNFKYIEAYRTYIIQVAKLLGGDESTLEHDIDDIIAFETNLAQIIIGSDFRRNVSDIYTKLSIGELSETIPQIDWSRYFNIIMEKQMNLSTPVVSYSMTYLQDLVYLLGRTPSRIIANYLMWRFIRHRVNSLDKRFLEAKQRFYYVLFGREKLPPRWQMCVSQVNSNLGMAVGALFVEKYFDEESKNDTLYMTRMLQASFKELLSLTSWLDDDTKELARLKIDAMRLKIGYPDFILNQNELNQRYGDITIDPDYYFENVLSVLKHLTRVEQQRLGTAVNKTLWNTAPAVVNAYYSRNKNQIMFPAGILQPPFYHRYFPHSLNFGGIGVVIGHEITHGFDDKGRLFDSDGNLQRWWNDISVEEFHTRANCLIEQYSAYTVPEVNVQVDGVNTQGENIADNGGIKQAYNAYSKWLQENPKAVEVLPDLNLTNTQLFFLNFAQIWCGTSRPDAARNKLKTAVHAPGRFRVLGVLSNLEEFSEVYKCPLNSPMNPTTKCRIW